MRQLVIYPGFVLLPPHIAYPARATPSTESFFPDTATGKTPSWQKGPVAHTLPLRESKIFDTPGEVGGRFPDCTHSRDKTTLNTAKSATLLVFDFEYWPNFYFRYVEYTEIPLAFCCVPNN